MPELTTGMSVCLSAASAGKVRTSETKSTSAAVMYGETRIAEAHWSLLEKACPERDKVLGIEVTP